MKIEVTQQDWTTVECDAMITLLPDDKEQAGAEAKQLDQKLGGLLTQLYESSEFKGETGEILVLYRPRGLKVERLVLAGNGPRPAADFGTIRNSILKAVTKLKGFALENLVVLTPSWATVPASVQAATEGVVLARFNLAEYKTEESSETSIGQVTIAVHDDEQGVSLTERVRRGEVLGEATNLARRLTNEPGNRVNPSSFSVQAEELAEKAGLRIRILDETDLEGLGMNAILAVAQGSSEPARLIVLSHNGSADPAESPIVFVGKGVTFDSGGISLKPAKSMEEMKGDKAGACSVLAAMKAIADLRLPLNVVALLPIVENLPGGKAQRPGDVVHSFSGKTIEVINTDAEGRLILADALSYAKQEFSPRCMVDIATLTGACIVALGHLRAGLFSNNNEFCSEVVEAADQGGERLWRLPLDSEYRKDLESQIADIKNTGNRWGGAIVAAKFLEDFVGETPWCHIDMAGVDLFRENHDVVGPTGFGVRTLVELAINSIDSD